MLQFLRELVFNVVELGGGEGGEVNCFFLISHGFRGYGVVSFRGRGGKEGGGG